MSKIITCENLLNILAKTPGHIFWKDINGVYQGANEAQATFLGYKTSKDLIGKTDFELPWKKQANDLKEIDDYVMTTQKEYCVEEIVNSQEGIKKIFLSRKIPLYDLNKEVIGVIGTSIDITESKQAELAKQEFIMNMAHDLRTPLTGIIGISNLIATSGASTEDRLNGQMINAAAEKLLELLNLFLELIAAKQYFKKLTTSTISFTELANELQTLMKPSVVTKRLDFQINLDANLPLICSDQIKIKQMLINLLSNAVKFTKEGKINLDINLLAIEDDKAKIKIMVCDTGIGIPKDKFDKIFDQFYRAYPSYQAEYKGYGVGLFLVKKAVELLGGEIKVSSKEGKGTCFIITLPVSLASKNSYKESVLLVEDEKFNIRNTEKILLSLDYRVITETTGEAALQTLEQTQEFDWVLLDLSLPDITGMEVVERYRQWEKKHNKTQLHIIAFVPHLTKETRKECFKVGFNNIITKPLTKEGINIINLFLGKKE